jgi:succinyl-CoA synthetase beta subunit
MDVIRHYGGHPANFLDIGGGASREQVAAALEIVLQDASVKGILVNIFGGIMDCDIIANGIVAAARQTARKLPVVIRLEGNNVEAARKTLAESGQAFIYSNSMDDAAQKIVKAVNSP